MGDNFISQMLNYYYGKGILYKLQIKEFESSVNLKSSTAKKKSSVRINNYSKYLTLTTNLELLDIIYLFCNLRYFPHFIYFKILSADFHINTEFLFFYDEKTNNQKHQLIYILTQFGIHIGQKYSQRRYNILYSQSLSNGIRWISLCVSRIFGFANEFLLPQFSIRC